MANPAGAHGGTAGAALQNHDELVAVVNELIETCRDGEFGFTACAERADGQPLRSLLQVRAADCRRAEIELETEVVRLGGRPGRGLCASAGQARGWSAVRRGLDGASDQEMLEECVRGEAAALVRYREALRRPMPQGLRAVVENHYQGLGRQHAHLLAMRQPGRAATAEAASAACPRA